MAAATVSSPATAREDGGPARSGADAVVLSALPTAVQTTHERIAQGGPFPYARDGSVFMNRERFLPPRPRGYYREYTVPTPGADDRGARRLVCGGTEPRSPDACYYTADHYASFRLVRP